MKERASCVWQTIVPIGDCFWHNFCIIHRMWNSGALPFLFMTISLPYLTKSRWYGDHKALEVSVSVLPLLYPWRYFLADYLLGSDVMLFLIVSSHCGLIDHVDWFKAKNRYFTPLAFLVLFPGMLRWRGWGRLSPNIYWTFQPIYHHYSPRISASISATLSSFATPSA